MNVQPSASFTDELAAGTSGLVGTIEVGIYQGDTVVTALQTAGINEIGTTGIYVATLTAPATAGQYTIIWSLDGSLDPAQVRIDDLTVTATVGAAPATSSLYITRAELKETLEIDTGESYADDDIDMACSGASDIIRGYKNTRYHPTTETRVYSTPVHVWRRYYRPGGCHVNIDALNALTSLNVDLDGDGVYETSWTDGVEFWLEPINAAADGIPYDRVVLRPQNGSMFPFWPNGIQIQGSFGWAETPDRVRQAAKILAARLLKRARETPYGIVTVIGEAVAAARLGRIDPDVAASLDNEYGIVPQPFA